MMPDFELTRRSLLECMFLSLGPFYGTLLPLSGLLAFVLVLILVVRGKGPMAVAALVFIVHVPFLIGVYGMVQGLVAAFSVLAGSPTGPTPSELAIAFWTALFTPLVGMLVMVPAYLTAVIGTFIRAMKGESVR
ncbi:MAG: hypothetical protein U1E05_14460 [Patescibacteria group bacterium]|nr:hypothetical protein [Patescibacteria group bacterium]